MHALLLYFEEKTASTVYDHIESFQKYSMHTIHFYNTRDGFITQEEIDQYDAVIIHYNLNIFIDHRCPPWLRVLLHRTSAKKIIFIQDEYRLVNDVVQILNYIQVDLLFTCIPEQEIEKIYPASILPNVKKVNTLTGFVPENLVHCARPSYEERDLDVVYRARKLSAWYGRLGREKWMIADLFSKDALAYGLKVNISNQEKDRIYGDQWIGFLKYSKAALGTESGASVFDFTGNIQRNVEQYEKEYPDAIFEEIEEKLFKGLDGKIKLNQISPRAFECAALGTLMILYEGDYSNILIPWQHYVPLKKDHSNMKEVVAVLRNPQQWAEITKRAYEEIAQNPKYSYKNFVKEFDSHFDDLFSAESLGKSYSKNISIIPKAHKQGILKAHYIKQEIQSPPYILHILGKIILILLKILPRFFRLPLEESLRYIKQRLTGAFVILKDLLENCNYEYLYSFWKQDFHEEYVMIFMIRDYLLAAKEIFGISPTTIILSDEQKVNINISSYFDTKDINNKQFINTAKCVTIAFENSCGVPRDLQNKQYSIKYKKLLKYILDI